MSQNDFAGHFLLQSFEHFKSPDSLCLSDEDFNLDNLDVVQRLAEEHSGVSHHLIKRDCKFCIIVFFKVSNAWFLL